MHKTLAACALLLASPLALGCFGAKHECPNLTGAIITYEKTRYYYMLSECGNLDSEACAKLNITANTCIIYYSHRFSIPAAVDLHERNHCYGWAHETEKAKTHDKEWHPMPQLKTGDK